MKSLENKAALVTGALAGIGRATAIALAKSGARVVVTGRRADAGEALVNDLKATGAEAIFVKTDVSKEDEIAAAVAIAVKTFGALDIAVNNAGVEGELGPINQASVANYQTIFDTNVKGTFLSLKHELAAMLPRKSGAIVNLASIVGHVGMANAALYAASKHAVEGLTKSAALEAAPLGVRVNAVAPGPVDTPMVDRFTGNDPNAKAGMATMIPLQRMSTPEEIAAGIVYLVSPGAGTVTGAILNIDGGWSAQ
ncbi:MAG: glucose 1-dehydrogenase [Rhodobacteraceae bacterium]|nr:glucose 1-dehydrogenase [Paracoccaceae bacterium]